MKSFFKSITFFILLLIVLVFIGVMWNGGPLLELYSIVEEYTNYILWIFLIIGGIAMAMDFKNINKIALIGFVISIIVIFAYFLTSGNEFSESMIINVESIIEVLKAGPLLFIALYVLLPVFTIFSSALGGEILSTFGALIALLVIFTIASYILMFTTRASNNMSKAARIVSLVATGIVILINIWFLLESNIEFGLLNYESLDTVINLYLSCILISFFAGVAFFTSNFGFDTIIEDVSMDVAEAVIQKNVSDLYTHPSAKPVVDYEPPVVQQSNEQSQVVSEIDNVQPPQFTPPVIEDNPLPFATEQVMKSDIVSDVQQ